MADKHEWARRLTHKIEDYSKRLSVGNAAFCALTQESDLLTTMAEAIQSSAEQLREVEKSLKAAREGLRVAAENIAQAQRSYEARLRGLMEEQPTKTENQ